MHVWNYTIAPSSSSPREGQITLTSEQGLSGTRSWQFNGGIPINEVADVAVDRFLADATTSGTITIAISTDVTSAARAYDYVITPGASRFSGRIVSCRRSPVNAP